MTDSDSAESFVVINGSDDSSSPPEDSSLHFNVGFSASVYERHAPGMDLGLNTNNPVDDRASGRPGYSDPLSGSDRSDKTDTQDGKGLSGSIMASKGAAAADVGRSDKTDTQDGKGLSGSIMASKGDAAADVGRSDKTDTQDGKRLSGSIMASKGAAAADVGDTGTKDAQNQGRSLDHGQPDDGEMTTVPAQPAKELANKNSEDRMITKAPSKVLPDSKARGHSQDNPAFTEYRESKHSGCESDDDDVQDILMMKEIQRVVELKYAEIENRVKELEGKRTREELFKIREQLTERKRIDMKRIFEQMMEDKRVQEKEVEMKQLKQKEKTEKDPIHKDPSQNIPQAERSRSSHPQTQTTRSSVQSSPPEDDDVSELIEDFEKSGWALSVKDMGKYMPGAAKFQLLGPEPLVQYTASASGVLSSSDVAEVHSKKQSSELVSDKSSDRSLPGRSTANTLPELYKITIHSPPDASGTELFIDDFQSLNFSGGYGRGIARIDTTSPAKYPGHVERTMESSHLSSGPGSRSAENLRRDVSPVIQQPRRTDHQDLPPERIAPQKPSSVPPSGTGTAAKQTDTATTASAGNTAFWKENPAKDGSPVDPPGVDREDPKDNTKGQPDIPGQGDQSRYRAVKMVENTTGDKLDSHSMHILTQRRSQPHQFSDDEQDETDTHGESKDEYTSVQSQGLQTDTRLSQSKYSRDDPRVSESRRQPQDDYKLSKSNWNSPDVSQGGSQVNSGLSQSKDQSFERLSRQPIMQLGNNSGSRHEYARSSDDPVFGQPQKMSRDTKTNKEVAALHLDNRDNIHSNRLTQNQYQRHRDQRDRRPSQDESQLSSLESPGNRTTSTAASNATPDDAELRARTVIVKGAAGVSDEVLELFFESKKKSGGGDITSLTSENNDDPGTVTIVFSDPEVASRVLSKQSDLVLEGRSLTVEEPPKPTQVDPCSIIVQNLNPSTSQDTIELWFESRKRTGGGDIKEVLVDPETASAIVIFEEEEVAQRVLAHAEKMPLTLEGHKLQIFPRILNMDSQIPEPQIGPEPIDPRVVLVEGIKPSTTKETVEMFFESKKKSGGGDLFAIEYEGQGHAKVTFEDEEVAQRVLSNTEFTLEGATLTAHLPTPTLPKTPPVMGARPKNSSKYSTSGPPSLNPVDICNVHTVMITGEKLIKEKRLKQALEGEGRRQAKDHPVEDVDLLTEKNIAIVKFKNPKDVEALLQKGTLLIDSSVYTVVALDTTLEDSGDYEGPLAICATQIPPNTPLDMIGLFFNNRRKSGGGQITNVYWNPEKGKAVITFQSVETVINVWAKHNQKPLNLNKADLTISRMEPPRPPPKLVLGPKEPRKLFVVDAPNVNPKQLQNYFSQTLAPEAQPDQPVIREILYSHEYKTILLDFTNMPDYAKLLVFCATVPLNDHMLVLQRVALPTRVQVHDIGDNTEMLELYFQDPRNGGDENVVLEDSDDQLKFGILECPNPKVVKALVQGTHVVQSKKVYVSSYYPEFGIIPLNHDPRRPWDYRPQPYLHKLGDPQIRNYIYEFLKASTEAQSLIKDIGTNANLFEISWDKLRPEGLEVCCLATYRPDPKGTKPWEVLCRHELDLLLSTVAVAKVPTLTDCLDLVLEAAQGLCNGKGVIVTIERDQAVVIVIGWGPDVQPIVADLHKLNKNLEQDLLRRTNSVEENMKLKTHHGVLIRALKYTEHLNKKYPNMGITFTKANEISFKGLPDEVKNAKLNIYEEIINPTVTDKIQMSPRKTALLKNKETKEATIKKFRADKVTAVMDIGNADVSLYALTRTEIQQATAIINDYIREQSLELQPENVPVLKIDAWQTLRTLHAEKYHGLLSVEEDLQNKKITVVCVGDILDEVLEGMKNCLDENTILEQFVGMPAGSMRLLEKHFKKDLTDVMEKFRSCNVSCDPVVTYDRSGYKVKGTKHAFPNVVTALSVLAAEVLEMDHVVKRPGMPAYFRSVRGKDFLENLELKHKITCEILNQQAPPMRTLEASSLNVGPDVNQEIHKVDLDGGFSITVLLGDMTKFKVDAIVNAANSRLQHHGGLAGTILKEGGDVIQDECDDHVTRKGQVLSGNVFVGKRTGKLPCDLIVHAVGPIYDSYGDNRNKCNELYEAIAASLNAVNDEELHSIAIPALSTGIYNFPVKMATKTICEAVLDFLIENPSSLKEVYLMDTLSKTVNSFKQALLGMMKEKGIATSSTSTEAERPASPQRNRRRSPQEGAEDEPRGGATAAPVTSRKKSVDTPPNWQKGPKPDTLITREGIMVQLRKTSIAKEKVDVIVNTSNVQLDLKAGAVSSTILKAAGPEIQAQCVEFAPAGVKFASIVRTSPGKIKTTKAIYHGACDNWDGGTGRSTKILKEFIHNCLVNAEADGYTSIALPAIGTGNLQFPRHLVSKFMFEEFLTFSQKNPRSSVTDIRVILYEKDTLTIKAFEDHVKELSAMSEPAAPSARNKQRVLKTRGNKQDKDTKKKTTSAYTGFTEEKDRLAVKVGDISLLVRQGDITDDTTEAIVNSTNANLDATGAVSAAIVKKGGKNIVEECKQILAAHTGGRIMGHALTRAGDLRCKYVVHMDAMMRQPWVQTIYHTLEFADRNRITSISFPALGTGALGKPPAEMAEAMLKAIADFSNSAPKYLSEVNITIFDKKVYKAFKSQIDKVMKGEGSSFLGNVFGMLARAVGFGGSSEPDETKTELSDPKSITLRMYAMSQEVIDTVVKRLEKLCEEETTILVLDKPDEQDMIKKLTSGEVAQILELENKHHIRVVVEKKTRLNRISLEGNSKDVATCSTELNRILHSVQKEKQAEQHAQQLLQFVQWEYKDDGNFKPYSNDISMIIEKAYNKKKKFASWEENEGKFQIWFDNMVEVETGRSSAQELQVRRKLQQSTDDAALPEEWEDMKDGEHYKLVQLQPTDPEYKDVEQSLRKTYNPNNIHKIERVQNPTLYLQYIVKKKHMDTVNPQGHQNEMNLYHGTAEATLKNINTTGFNRSYCGKNAVVIGNGVYFARDANYSAQNTYTPPDMNGHKHMYQCRVLTGEFTRGQSGLVAPPPKNPTVPNILFDCVVDNPAGPSVFVIFNDTQAYPEYLITFN